MPFCRLFRSRFGPALFAGAVLLTIGHAHAADDLDTILRDYDAAAQKFVAAAQGVAVDLTKHPANEFLPKVQAYADGHAGKPDAVPALVWMLKNARSAGGHPTGGKAGAAWAVERLARDHVADPAIKQALPALRYLSFQVGDGPLTGIYERVVEKNPDREAKSMAAFNLAQTLYVGSGGDDAGRAANRQRAKSLFRRVVQDYAGTPAARDAEEFIKSLQGTRVGQEAPEIVGNDENDKEIRLSQFHGQVVMLDFWGFW